MDAKLDTKIAKLSLADSPRKFLVLLDVNGLLCCKVDDPRVDVSKFEVQRANKYKTVARPDCRKFVAKLMDTYTVGIFSSTTAFNLNKILPWLLGKELRSKIVFIADRHSVKFDPNYGTCAGIESHDTVKYLDDIWSNPCFNWNRDWNSTNTLLVDNDLRKVKFNEPANYLVVEEWDIKSTQTLIDVFLDIQAKIEKF
jgi:hypothetical protein